LARKESEPGPLPSSILERTDRLDKAERKDHTALEARTLKLVRTLVSGQVRLHAGEEPGPDQEEDNEERPRSKYFEVLFVDDLDAQEEMQLKRDLAEARDASDAFVYDAIVVPTVQDALIALLFNPNIQACVVRYGMPYASAQAKGFLRDYIRAIRDLDPGDLTRADMGPLLGKILRWFRPEVDRYYVTDTPGRGTERHHRAEFPTDLLPSGRSAGAAPHHPAGHPGEIRDPLLHGAHRIQPQAGGDLPCHAHLARQLGVQEPLDPGFRGVLRAQPAAGGDLQHGGRPGFPAAAHRSVEARTGARGLRLRGAIHLFRHQRHQHQQQDRAAGPGGTQGHGVGRPGLPQEPPLRPGHHGAFPVYLDSYPLPEFSMYGAVPLEHIREKMLELKRAGRLQHVKMLLLTNCTFDGVVYNVQRVMEEVLAIKPDMIFLWDEAWFAFAGFSYIFKQRTAMFSAARLHRKYHSEAYRKEYKAHMASLGPAETPRLPDPDKVRIRVYATQSTHKTLTSLRQGSMIHIWDEDFRRKSEDSFHEAYMAHTSTSPNYQILASLDVGRRQVEFEGYELVEKAIEQGMLLRHKINEHPKLRRYFDVITPDELVPAKFRPSGLKEYYSKERGWHRIEEAWANDEFAVDPTKINLYTGKTGVDGDTFKNRYLMDKHAIQVNKTSRNSVLFMTNIGTTRGSVAYLIKVLLTIADELEARNNALNPAEKQLHIARIRSLTQETPPLPDFSRFHDSFRAVPGVPGGDLRKAYFLAYSERNCEYVKLPECQQYMEQGQEMVSASFVIPYPPGFPILVPGQVVSKEILAFLIALDVKEIHGYRKELGLRIFNDHALARQRTGTAMAGMPTAQPMEDGGKGRKG
jgi:arginine/lysine/ornithine decarboxylase